MNPAAPPLPPVCPAAPVAPAPPLPHRIPPAPPLPPGVVALAPSPISGRPNSDCAGALIALSVRSCRACNGDELAASAAAYAPAPVLSADMNRAWKAEACALIV